MRYGILFLLGTVADFQGGLPFTQFGQVTLGVHNPLIQIRDLHAPNVTRGTTNERVMR
jgi:hypothetical protein